MRTLVRIAFTLLLLILGVAAVSAQEGQNTVSVNGFSFSFPDSLGPNVNVERYPGDALDEAYPGGPQPPYTRFSLYSALPAPQGSMDAPIAITVYRLSAVAPYTFYQQQVEALQALLAERPDLAPYMTLSDASEVGSESLPFLPVYPAAQEIRARAQYLDTSAFSGISYVTSYGQDASPILANELIYTFQGLSSDGTTYVALQARLDTDLIASEIPADFNYDAFIQGIAEAFNETISSINGGAASDFTPSLDALQALVGTLNQGSLAVPPIAILPTPTPAVVNTDPTLGGLAGTWALVSFGPADAPQTPVEGTPITLAFSDQGVFGTDGCNTYRGSFSYNSGTLTFSPLASTLMACQEPIMSVAFAYLTALQGVTAYAVSGDTLTLSAESGALIYTRAEG